MTARVVRAMVCAGNANQLTRQSKPPDRKDFVVDADLLHHLRLRHTMRRTRSQNDLTTCSLCLRVLRGSEWIEAEHVIRWIRSYELESPPRQQSAVCDFCAESIFSRRASAAASIAA
jgi:hypothetical protein